MKWDKRGALGAMLLTVLSILPQAADANDLVRIGSFQGISDAGIFVAKEKGFFAEQGIDIEIQVVGSASDVTTAFASGKLDVAGGSPSAGIYNAIRQGLPIEIVADSGNTSPGFGYSAFMVRKEMADKIKEIADIRGHTLAATGYYAGASNEVTVHHLLSAGGVKESELKIVALSFPDIMTSLGTKAIDAGILIEPLVTMAVEQNVAVVWKRGDAVYPSQQYACLMFGPSMTKRTQVAERFMTAYLKGVRFYNDALKGKAPKAELVAILTKNTAAKNAALYDKMVYPGLNPNGTLNVTGMAKDMQWFVDAKRMKEPIDLSKVVNTSYVDAALKKIGKYE